MPHPDYKDNPLWIDAMRLVREAYALAERVRGEAPVASRRLRKAAVAVPANIAGILHPDPEREAGDCAALARGALAEIERQVRLLAEAAGEEAGPLVRHARRLATELVADENVS